LAYRRSSAVRHEILTDPTGIDDMSSAESAQWGEPSLSCDGELERVLGKISEPQRIVFVLFEVDELNGNEIASLLNVSVGTVRSRLRYARATFRREARRLALQDSDEAGAARP
jgi:RNA polymerase sigma-70 factor (ECF subfamily)